MRIGLKERRILQRRLKNRLPPVFPFNLPRIGLVVTATVIIDPSALALIANGEAMPLLAPMLVEKKWDKTELGKSMPANPVRGLDTRIADEVTAVLLRMAKNQRNEKSRQAQQKIVTTQPTNDDYLLSLSNLKDAPKTRAAEGSAITSYMSGEGQKASSDHIKDNVTFVKNLQRGLNFDLNVLSVFENSSKNSNKSGEMRYGLVLKDIKADPNAPKRAAIADMSDEMEFAGHAKVEWTIGPLDEERGRVMYSEITAKNEKASSDESTTTSFKIPKPNFKGKAKPELGNLAGIGDDNLPKWTIEIYQEEGYYTLVYQSKSTGERIGQEHRFRVPIYGEMNVGRRFNDKWQAIETSAYNVLIDKQLPIVSVHQMHIEQRYRVEAAQSIGRHKVGFTHQSEAKNPASVKEKERPESYSLKFETEF